MVTRLKYPQKNTSIGLYRRNPTSFNQEPRKRSLGRAGEGNAEGSPTGFQHPIRWKTSIGDAVNGVPTTAHIQLAGRAVDRGGRLSALFRGTAAVCTAQRELRRHVRRARQRLLYVDPSDWKLQVGSVRHHRGWQREVQARFRQRLNRPRRVRTAPKVVCVVMAQAPTAVFIIPGA